MNEMKVCADLAMKSSVRYWANCVIDIGGRVPGDLKGVVWNGT